MESAEQHVNPYAAPAPAADIPVDQGPRVLASRLVRLGAVFVDNVMIIALLCPGYLLLRGDFSAWEPVLVPAAWIGTPLGVALIILNIVLLVRDGQTLAKRWFGLRVVRADGTRCGAARLLGLRYVIPMVISATPCVGHLFSLVDPLMIFGEDRRCLHDKMADTIVVQV
ncbi:MAG: RDD family protein [Xanthomonadaceae bacterium]|nr:RDD family protein [Xanthomonadaceae bacterium]